MAALVQTYPQQISTVNMLQARPSSATGMMSGQSQGHQYMGSGPVPAQGSRASSYGAPPSGYRGSSGPGQPRAFNNQQNLNHNLQWQQYTAYRTNSSPAIPAASQFDPNMPYRGHVPANSASNMGYTYNFNIPANAARDDSSLSPRTPQQAAYYNVAGNAKPAPDRYRRVNAQAAQHNRSQSTNLPSNLNQPGGLYQLHNGSMSVPNLSGGMPGSTPASKDDMSVHHRASAEDRMRRRSMHSMDNMDMSKSGSSSYGVPERSGSPRLASGSNVHSRNGSSESVTSTRSSHSRPSSVSFSNCLKILWPNHRPFTLQGVPLTRIISCRRTTVACPPPLATPLSALQTTACPPSRSTLRP